MKIAWTLVVGLAVLPHLVGGAAAAARGRAYDQPLDQGYAPEPRFRSPCAEDRSATLLGCMPQALYAPSVTDVDVWNALSGFNANQHRPYPTLSPWAR